MQQRPFGTKPEAQKDKVGSFGRKIAGFMVIYLVIWIGFHAIFQKEWTIKIENPSQIFSQQAVEQIEQTIGEAPIYLQGFTFDLGKDGAYREKMSFGAVPYELLEGERYEAWYVSYNQSDRKPYALHKINKEFQMDNPPHYTLASGYKAMEQVSGHLKEIYNLIPAELTADASAVFLSTASTSAYPDGSGGPAPVAPGAVSIDLDNGITATPGIKQETLKETTLYIYSRRSLPGQDGKKVERTDLVAVANFTPGAAA